MQVVPTHTHTHRTLRKLCCDHRVWLTIKAMLATLDQDQTITQRVDCIWSVEHHRVWQGMTLALSAVKKQE